MIKINLATKKKGVGAGRGAAAAFGGLGGVELGDAKQLLKDLPIRKVALMIIVGIGFSYLSDGYKADEIKNKDAVIEKLTAEQLRLRGELAKTKNFEELKKQLETDEAMIRAKIDTIQKLIAERSIPGKMMTTVANQIPKDVWLTDLLVAEKELQFKGFSVGFNEITDFLKNMTETEYYRDLRLENTQQGKDDTGTDVASFELQAKRK